MPSAHCDSSGSSGSGDQMPDFDGVHDRDACSLSEHNRIDCGQPMLMLFVLLSRARNATDCHYFGHAHTFIQTHPPPPSLTFTPINFALGKGFRLFGGRRFLSRCECSTCWCHAQPLCPARFKGFFGPRCRLAQRCNEIFLNNHTN